MQAEEVLVGETRFAKGGSRVCSVLGSLRPLLPPATQGQTRLSLSGLSNIPRWTKCRLPSQNTQLDRHPLSQRETFGKLGSHSCGSKVGGGWGVAPELQFKDTSSRLSPSTSAHLEIPAHCASLRSVQHEHIDWSNALIQSICWTLQCMVAIPTLNQ